MSATEVASAEPAPACAAKPRLARLLAPLKTRVSKILQRRRKAMGGPFGVDARKRASARNVLLATLLWRLRSIVGLVFFVGVYLLLSFDGLHQRTVVDEHGFSHGVHVSMFNDDTGLFRIRNLLQEAAQTETQQLEPLVKAAQLAGGGEAAADGVAEDGHEGSTEGDAEAVEARRRTLVKMDCVPASDIQPTAYPFLYLPETLFLSSCDGSDLPLSSASPDLAFANAPPAFLCQLLRLLASQGVEAYLQPFFLADEEETERRGAGVRSDQPVCGFWHYNLVAVAKSDRGDSRDALAVLTSVDYSLLHLPSLMASSPESSSLPFVPGAGSVASVSAAVSIFLQQSAPWLSRDVIFVFSDLRLPYAAGARAWLWAYMRSVAFFPRRGLLRMAVALEPDRESPEREEGFRFLSPDVEGTDGRLPNQDIVNVVISEAGRVGARVRMRNTWEYVFRMARNWGAHRPHAPLLEEAVPAVTVVAKNGAQGGRAAAEAPFTRWGDLARVLERVTRSQSNVLQTLHHSFNFYFFVSEHSHVSSGGYLYPVFIMLALLLVPILSSRVMRDIRGFLAGVALLLLAFACSLPAFILATKSSVNELLFGDPYALVPFCSSWQREAYLQYAQKASVWLQIALAFYALLLAFVWWLGRRIKAQRIAAGEDFPSSLSPLRVSATPFPLPWGTPVAPSAQLLFTSRNPATLWETPIREKTEDEKAREREAKELEDALKRVLAAEKREKAAQATPVDSAAAEDDPTKAPEDGEETAEEKESDEQVETAWSPPQAPPPLWLVVRGFCVRVFAVWIMVMLTLLNWGMSAFLSLFLIPMAWLVVPLRFQAEEPPRPCLRSKEGQQGEGDERMAGEEGEGEAKEGEDEKRRREEKDLEKTFETEMKRWKRRRRMVMVATVLRKLLVALFFLVIIVFVSDSDTLKAYRGELQATTQDAAAYAYESLSTVQKAYFPSFPFLPFRFLQWLRGGSTFAPLTSSPPQYPLGSSSRASALSSPLDAEWEAAGRSAEFERRLRVLIPLGSALPLPEKPSSFLLFLYSMARDSVCVHTADFSVFLFGLMPFCFFLAAVFLVLPP
ncbi:hypothetical protein BESB_044500 [Besnoitia besnoiti]|uniref:Glycosylphosphatidylinositol anchor attachment protein 1 n=1 Tax=Besnoitia besnoiti TaxID=94643 RepID=A0A2A9MCN9_BESBE|nr:hypothetical protein BESB_044500 [Besnoitia besnoiti]PFH36258.1 hypothetical protein BESB_044500 [Besnoitia besnoiti]